MRFLWKLIIIASALALPGCITVMETSPSFSLLPMASIGWEDGFNGLLTLFPYSSDTLLIIRNFYFICLAMIAIFLIIGALLKKKELMIRSVTLLALLHITCLALWLGPGAFILFIGVLMVLSLLEIARNFHIHRPLFWVINAMLLMLLLLSGPYIVYTIPFFIATVIYTFMGKRTVVRHAVYGYIFSCFFVMVCALFSIYLMRIKPESIIVILLLLQLNDAFGLLFGKLLGKRHIFKTISPNKTLEGYIFGALGIAIGIFLLHTVIPVYEPTFSVDDVILFGFAFLFGNTGDLLLSSLKRKLEIKDFSQILPGHGGILDRFDNIFFVAPLFYLFYLWNLIAF